MMALTKGNESVQKMELKRKREIEQNIKMEEIEETTEKKKKMGEGS